MKKVLFALLHIVFLPVVLLVLLCFILYTPVDYVKYRRSRYRKDTGVRYTWLAGVSCYVRLYDLIKRENLPIEYYRGTEEPTTYGFFLYGDTLILNDYDPDPHYVAEQDAWLVEIEDEYVDIAKDVDEVIARCNEKLGTNRCQKAVVLIDRDVWEEHPEAHYERVEFLATDGDADAESIKEWIKAKNGEG